VFLHYRQENDELVSAWNLASGRQLWQRSYPAPFQKNQYAVNMQPGPFSTPLVVNGRLYTLGATGVVSCFDASSGQLVWRKDFSKKVDTKRLFYGTSMSPVAVSGKLIVHVGDDLWGGVIALELKDGHQVWAWHGDGPSYASPVLATIAERRLLITLTDQRAIALDPADGSLQWSLPFQDEWNENIITPLVVDGRFILFSGVRRGTILVEPVRDLQNWNVRTVWENRHVSFYMSTPVLDGELLYGFSGCNKGQFVCLNPRTGTWLWASEGRQGEHASLVSCGGVLLALLDEGELRVIQAWPGRYHELASYEVSGASTWAHPVPASEGLLVRDDAGLSLWAIPAA
jgi:outer membrane protein assembly factor BamB